MVDDEVTSEEESASDEVSEFKLLQDGDSNDRRCLDCDMRYCDMPWPQTDMVGASCWRDRLQNSGDET